MKTAIQIEEIQDPWVQQTVQQAIDNALANAEAWLMKDGIGEDARQGDVYLVRVAAQVPNSPTTPGPNHFVLVKGEATGNTHVLKTLSGTYSAPATTTDPFILGMLDLKCESVLVHQEHGPIIVPQGTYEVRGQFQGANFKDRLAD